MKLDDPLSILTAREHLADNLRHFMEYVSDSEAIVYAASVLRDVLWDAESRIERERDWVEKKERAERKQKKSKETIHERS